MATDDFFRARLDQMIDMRQSAGGAGHADALGSDRSTASAAVRPSIRGSGPISEVINAGVSNAARICRSG
jgi:hypothetical protein